MDDYNDDHEKALGESDQAGVTWKEEWDSIPLEQAVVEILKQSKMTNVEGVMHLRIRSYGIRELLEILVEHHELKHRPSERAKLNRLRRATENSDEVVKHGNTSSAVYMYDPDGQIERAQLLVFTEEIVHSMLDVGGSTRFPWDNHDEGSFLIDARDLLVREGVIAIREDGSTVCTPRAWSFQPGPKMNSTFTLTNRTGHSLEQIVGALGKGQAEIEGYPMAAPISVSKSGVIDIAVAMLRRHLGLETQILPGLVVDPRDQP